MNEDFPCGIPGHYAWTLVPRRFLLLWKRWWLTCLQCEMARAEDSSRNTAAGKQEEDPNAQG
jgi:hypothetical protein